MPNEPRPALVAGTAAVVFAWYALPDVVRSRTARGLLKTGLLAATAAAVPTLLATDEAPALPDGVWPPTPAALAGGVALLAAGTAATVWGERAVFAFGERRRARGVRFAHALPALGLAALAAASLAVDPPRQG